MTQLLDGSGGVWTRLTPPDQSGRTTPPAGRRGAMPGAVALTTIAVPPVLLALVALDIFDASVRAWFDEHAFTSAVITSILVLLITVLIVDRVVARRGQRERGLVMAAQAAIISRQARRTIDLVKDALTDSGQREPASDELRTYMAMLLVSAPVLIEAPAARAFLESAQRLAALMSIAMEHDSSRGVAGPPLDAAVEAMREAAAPLLAAMDRAQLRAVDSGEDGPAGPGGGAAAGPGGGEAAAGPGGDQARAGT